MYPLLTFNLSTTLLIIPHASIIHTANVLTKRGWMKPSKYVECLFYLKNISVQLPLSLVIGEALSWEKTVKYIGVRFNSNLTWSTHIDSVFTKDFASIKKCIRLPSTSSGVAYTHICKILISQQDNSCTRLCSSIINDPLDRLHACLSNALSPSNTRSFF